MINSRYLEKNAGVYVHFPYCKSKCTYCNFLSSPNFSTQGKYVSRLIEEISATSGKPKADTVYFGGGTPSVMPKGTVSAVADAVKNAFDVCELIEFTVEANPDSVTDEFIAECASSGVTRISMGLQSANDEILKNIGRIHTVDRFVEAVDIARRGGIKNIASDLILGLPGQSETDVVNALALFDRLNIDHFSAYALTVEEGTPLHRSGYRPDCDAQADLYDLVIAEMARYGYVRYETSNFMRNDAYARHNYKYWIGADYYGFGAAAHSLVGAVRRANPATIEGYLSGEKPSSTPLTRADARTEYVMLRLRTCEGIDLSDHHARFAVRLEDERADRLAAMTAQGVVKLENGRLTVTDKGAYVLDSIILELI